MADVPVAAMEALATVDQGSQEEVVMLEAAEETQVAQVGRRSIATRARAYQLSVHEMDRASIGLTQDQERSR